ncbi:LytR/AlgR family response regulator transcription factor [Polaribacter ponticola]|uniref:LytTR family DNA-binding domain-containing protein n=1 Tax=Polaribacter ponticola TaxID=2978475 RepID=A0ABT5SB96_9FLAO|nr:LytTR family DNA-binding domain-containing protein [Polaribacter sp. MSW5]MDD7915381.1 LytTR family DNA-binding domain-containing protein [Polaribacter sp. MSW5]
MDCIIIDDDATARLIIKKFCLKSDQINVIEEFSSAIDAIKYLNTNNNIDLIYLDIHMPTFSGFDFIKTLNNPPKIILTTSDKNLALEAFEYKSVVDYLVKPITFERYNKSLEKLDSLSNKENDVIDDKNKSEYIYVNVDRRLVKVNIASIYLIEAKGDYINIKTNEKNYIVHSTLKKILDKLPSNMFFKVHRSFIINVSEIIDIEDNSVLVRKDVVPVSRSNKSELMKKLNLL